MFPDWQVVAVQAFLSLVTMITKNCHSIICAVFVIGDVRLKVRL
jgi:hypothetical protein